MVIFPFTYRYIDGKLDKESTSYNDIFDAFRFAMKFYRFGERRDE
jgi:hypothetical protein